MSVGCGLVYGHGGVYYNAAKAKLHVVRYRVGNADQAAFFEMCNDNAPAETINGLCKPELTQKWITRAIWPGCQRIFSVMESNMYKAVRTIFSTALVGTAVLASPAGAQDTHSTKHEEHKHSEQAHGRPGVGKPGDPKKVTRTIQVIMHDSMRFVPQSITVKRGDVIRFNVVNAGKLKHEMVIGSLRALQEHAKMMQRFPEMEHAEPNQATVESGKSGVIVWQFDTTGKVNFACLQPGHFEAGMKGVVEVIGK